MARTPSQPPEYWQDRLGKPPFSGMDTGIFVNADNRALVQKWLTASGVPSTVAKGMPLLSLAKCYNIRAYFETVKTRHANDAPTPDDDADELPGIDTPAPTTPTPPALTAVLDDKTSAALQALKDLLGGSGGGLTEAAVIALIQKHAYTLTRVSLVYADGTEKPLPDEVRHPAFARVLKWVKRRRHVALVGPAGSGKSTLAEQVARALDMPFYLGAAVYSEFQLTGYKDAAGVYHPTSFRLAYENGGLYLQDEADASEAQPLNWLNTATANGHAAFPDGLVKRHPNFVMVLAMNTWGKGATREYVGRAPLDGATLDRFAFVPMDYDEVMERQLAGKDDWTHYVQRVRRAIEVLKIKHIVSPRASIMGAEALADGDDRSEVEESLIWKGLDAETVTKIKHQL